MLHRPTRPKFIPFTLRSAFFELLPNLGKSAPNDPKLPGNVQSQGNTYAYIPEAQVFTRFVLHRAVFEEINIFEFPIGYNVKLKYFMF